MPDPMLARLIDDVPPPAPDLADGVLRAAGRRSRRRWAAVGAAAATVSVAVGVPAVAALNGPSPRSTVGAASSDRPRSPSVQSPTSPSSVSRVPTMSDRARIYVAAVRYALEHHTSPWVPTRVVIRDRPCASAVNGFGGGCEARIPADVRDAVLTALHGGPTPGFVSRLPQFSPADDPTRAARTLYLVFGPLHRDAGSAQLWVQQICGFNCERGDELLLRRTGTAWRVTGVRGSYIS